MADLKRFLLDLDAFKKTAVDKALLLQKRVALDLYARIIRRTPVDTGRARASWNLSVGKPDRSIKPEGRYDTPRATIGSLPPVTHGQVIWISNNLPYIGALEHGHSQQAPVGMVAISVEEVRAQIAILKNQLG